MTLTKYQNWYTSLPGHDYFCDVHEDFIEDDFNLTGMFCLPSSFPSFPFLLCFPRRSPWTRPHLNRAQLTKTGLPSLIPFWKEALEMVLDVEPGKSSFTQSSTST